MSKALICLLYSLLLTGSSWLNDLHAAKKLAQTEHKHILLNFSGSDWCGPCILLKRDIFDNPDFLKMADTSLVLVNADFPRKKKDQLSTAQQQLNNAMADQYDPMGKFPLTLLLNANGQVLKTWEGNPGTKPADFAGLISQVIETDK